MNAKVLTRTALSTLVVAGCGFAAAAPASADSLRFYGTGSGDIDRVKIPIDDPAVPADVGAGDFTIELWMAASPLNNSGTVAAAGDGDGWTGGNVLLDRDIFGDGENGDFGLSIGRLPAGGDRLYPAFGIADGDGNGTTIVGDRNVAKDRWQHIAITRDASSGQVRIWVNGGKNAEGTGPTGDVSYADGRATSYPASDPFLVLGAEKHDAGPAFPSFNGWVDEVRISDTVRYTAKFDPPAGPFAPDGDTAALYHLDEGSGTVITDASGGGSDGTREVGGPGGGPVYSSLDPWTGPAPDETPPRTGFKGRTRVEIDDALRRGRRGGIRLVCGKTYEWPVECNVKLSLGRKVIGRKSAVLDKPFNRYAFRFPLRGKVRKQIKRFGPGTRLDARLKVVDPGLNVTRERLRIKLIKDRGYF